MAGPPGATQRAASKFIIFENFERLNTAEVRQGLKESELAWVENLQPIAPNNWTTVPGPSSSLVTLAQTFTEFFYGALKGVDYIVGFTAAGGGWAIRIDNGTTTQFAADGTFSTSPDMTSWQGQRFLFNDSIAGYCSWDGSIFNRQGGVSSQIVLTNSGLGYTSAPSVTISGGSGSGATAVATIAPPTVTQIIIDNGGSGYLSVPTVNFAPATGGPSATATIDPRGITAVIPGAAGRYSPISALGPAPSVVVNLSGGGGSGASVTANMAVDGTGFFYVASYSFVAGSGYTSAPTANITPGPNTTQSIQATCTLTVGTGNVTSVVVTAGGTYATAPAITFTGGSPGVTATGHAIIGGGGVATITLTNPGTGYLAGDVLTVSFAGGGGSGAAATAKVAPFLPKGTSVAVFQGRVWLNFFANGQLTGLQWSGVNGFDDWDAAHASGALVLPDTDLVHQITGVRSFNNFLWIIGDQSIKQIGNISLNNAGNVTLFTILTLSSDQGTTFLRSCISFNRVFFFVNQNGVYAVFGSSVQKVSGDLDGIFKNTVFPSAGGVQPQGTLVDINNIHCVAWLITYTDLIFTGTVRSLFVVFDGKRWFPASQGDSIKTVTNTCTLASPNWVPYASSGGDVTGIFNNANTQVNVRLMTALSHHGNPVQRKKTVRLGYAMTLKTGTATVGMEAFSDEATLGFNANLTARFQTRTVADPNISGTYLGMGFSGPLFGFTLTNLRMEYQETNVGNQS